MVNGAFMILKGHRSIVNQVRFNPHTYMICSSGVEKVIKVGDTTITDVIYIFSQRSGSPLFSVMHLQC